MKHTIKAPNGKRRIPDSDSGSVDAVCGSRAVQRPVPDHFMIALF